MTEMIFPDLRARYGDREDKGNEWKTGRNLNGTGSVAIGAVVECSIVLGLQRPGPVGKR